MFKFLLFTLAYVLSFCVAGFAQKADSVFVIPAKDGWTIRHKVIAGETLFSIARRYHAPPAAVSDLNNIGYQQQLTANTKVLVPVGAYNLKTAKPSANDFRPVYYRVDEEERLYRIARNTGVTQRTIQQWNNMDNNELRRGQVLLVGWVLFDPTVTSVPKPEVPSDPVANSGTVRPGEQETGRHNTARVDTIMISSPTVLSDTLSEGEQQYLTQTFNGTVVAEEKGTAAFFKRAGRSVNGIYFAFHNTARRGTILKIYNPGTDKTVYAKVIGKVPVNQTFYNALIGISSDAKAELEVRGEKAWCEISFAP